MCSQRQKTCFKDACAARKMQIDATRARAAQQQVLHSNPLNPRPSRAVLSASSFKTANSRSPNGSPLNSIPRNATLEGYREFKLKSRRRREVGTGTGTEKGMMGGDGRGERAEGRSDGRGWRGAAREWAAAPRLASSGLDAHDERVAATSARAHAEFACGCAYTAPGTVPGALCGGVYDGGADAGKGIATGKGTGGKGNEGRGRGWEDGRGEGAGGEARECAVASLRRTPRKLGQRPHVCVGACGDSTRLTNARQRRPHAHRAWARVHASSTRCIVPGARRGGRRERRRRRRCSEMSGGACDGNGEEKGGGTRGGCGWGDGRGEPMCAVRVLEAHGVPAHAGVEPTSTGRGGGTSKGREEDGRGHGVKRVPPMIVRASSAPGWEDYTADDSAGDGSTPFARGGIAVFGHGTRRGGSRARWCGKRARRVKARGKEANPVRG
ncbi:hypothetical protein C8F04DRAFT_1191379 [Mycena alexandri]|uniref:Uncharacterized protein n=1 Tax=Mycena alexandri TaxID=1745969 RepID=A0AAD6SEE8_9AGAR|nr:hypothetical protein C8F04DRAFT_1191379 [Mycena alexandri]